MTNQNEATEIALVLRVEKIRIVNSKLCIIQN